AGTALGAGWAMASALLLGLVAATALRAGRARRRWPRADVGGVDVRVAPEAGPAVMGILRPEIVVPAWLLDASPDEQRLVVLHEREHVRARDPMLLAAGCVAAALVPWSPAAWWMLLRLRAAVELDCDARVLRGGVARRTYGSLLIDMAGRGPGLSLGSPALAGSPSTLERRLRAMNTRIPRFARLRASLLGVLGVALLAGACETQLPTSAELERMDVATMEARSLQLHPSAEGRTITYIVDDREVTAQEAHALPADRIAQVNIQGGTVEGQDIVRIYTKEGTPTVVPDGADRGHAPTPARGGETGARTMFDGLVVIDGVISDPATLHRLAPDDIAQVDVLKGAAASAQYSDPRAANGVIRVTTKAAAGTNR
ncbi:MAG TPA: M56 family metallopeptidase, partial [Longimicrobium sp.]|nr:M56 family metallopeptidase [Longimicrobium sp.]